MKPNRNLPSDAQQEDKQAHLFIPNLCNAQSLLFLLILTQLFTLIFSLIQESKVFLNWELLGLSSLFNHCLVLICAGALCAARPFLDGKNRIMVSTFCFAIIVSISVLYSWLSAKWIAPPGVIPEPFIFVSKVATISTILGALILRYFYLQDQWRNQKQAELTARIEALQARIRPHFLFNSMNSIASLITSDPERAEDAVLDLSELFRATLKTQEIMIPLEQEITLCRRYLNIEGLRLGNRLEVAWELEGYNGTVKIPPLTLQPLVENAIYHGIQPRKDGGRITIQSYCRNKTAYVLISNPIAEEETQSKHGGNQIALENTKSRLIAIFDDSAVLKTSQRNGVFTATVRFPVRT